MSTRTKRTIKFLATCKEILIIRAVLKNSPSNSVFKSISNAALNCASGEIAISDKEKSSFQKHRKAFELLSKKQSLKSIKKFLLQNKSKFLHIIPTILDCVLRSIGTSFIVEDSEKHPKKKNVNVPKVHFDKPERTGSCQGEENKGVQPECSSTSQSGAEH